jgi:N-acyl-D-amino-acid deacylase
VVFSEGEFRDRSTYQQPTLMATGMRHVLVNGKVVVENGSYNGTLGGRVLRGPGYVASGRGVPSRR